MSVITSLEMLGLSFEDAAIKYVFICLNSRPGRTYRDDSEPEMGIQRTRGEYKGQLSCSCL